jgi:transmembrane sensor
MTNYENYQLEDFLLEDSFRQWVHEGCAPEDTIWGDYLIKYPANKDEYEEAIKFVKECMEFPGALNNEQLHHNIRLILTDIQEKEKPVYTNKWYRSWGYAAIITLILGITGYYFSSNWSQNNHLTTLIAPEAQITVYNSDSTERRILLPDGSEVTLYSESRISYSPQFKNDSIRMVYLTGDAFFDVTRDPAKPFFVHSANITTKVLGTSFTIKSGVKDISVTVKTGIVAVSKTNEESDKLILLPNQKAVYVPEMQKLTKTTVQQPLIAESKEVKKKLSFDEEPVVNILHELEKTYQIAIWYDHSKLKNCHVTLPFGEEPFDQKLDILCRTIQASYRVTDKGIYIESDGCE